jgi:hypothetical protein
MSHQWTPEQREVFAQLSKLGVQARRDRVRAQINERYPELPDDERARLAEDAYRQEMSAQARAQWRRQRRRGHRAA